MVSDMVSSLPRPTLARDNERAGRSEQGIVEWVPLPRAIEPDLKVVVRRRRLVEHPAHAVAEVALGLEDQGADRPSGRKACEQRIF